VRHFDGHYVLMQRDRPTDRNPEVRASLERAARTIALVRTARQGGSNRADRNGEGVRHWKPGRKKPPVVLAFGKRIELQPGRYRAELTFRSRPPRTGGEWGRFELWTRGTAAPLAAAALVPSDSRDDRVQALTFSLEEATGVEPRITGGWAPLWLLEVEFVRENDAPGLTGRTQPPEG
jgi:hypothetical protein